MEKWKSNMIEYFAAGSTDRERIGVELEHFIVSGITQEAVDYSASGGIRTILSMMMEQYPEAVAYFEDDLLGFEVPEFTVTLEPASQLEISIRPTSSVAEAARIYRSFRDKLDPILARLGLEPVTAGCQPVSRVKELNMIPKKRYGLMNDHFKITGTGGMEMMRGTSSMQVSIDYASEDDFRRKIQAAYYYGPVLKLLTDNSETFQGRVIDTYLKRTDIWRRTDPVRCGILPGVFSDNYGFEDYAEFIGKVPPIFIKRGSDIKATGVETVETLFDGKEMDEDMIRHVLSMVFPDVRLKQYIEIRFADSVPLPFLLAYCALLKGLLYSEEGIGFAQEQIHKDALCEKDILAAEDDMIKRGWDADVYGTDSRKLAQKMLSIAHDRLGEEEKKMLEPFTDVIHYGGIGRISSCDMQRLYSQAIA